MNPDEPDKQKNLNAIKNKKKDPIKEALTHPNGPGLMELINGEEEKPVKKKPENDEPEAGPIPVI